MRTPSTTAALAVLFLLAIPIRPTAGQAADDVARLTWLAGCWEQRVGDRLTEEQWMSPGGGLMLGMSRTIIAGAAREYEHVKIEMRDGKATYVASPSGQATAAFSATRVTGSDVTFENLDHDFPKRIRYRRVETDSLVGTIEGPRGGRDVAIDFPMRRAACPGG